jgi:hypothetical protein
LEARNGGSRGFTCIPGLVLDVDDITTLAAQVEEVEEMQVDGEDEVMWMNNSLSSNNPWGDVVFWFGGDAYLFVGFLQFGCV